MEFCETHSLAIGNTFCNCAHGDRATYRHIGTSIAEPISEKTHLQLDLGIFPQEFINDVDCIKSDRMEPLASHHFVVVAQLNVALGDHHKPAERVLLYDRSALKDAAVSAAFTECFAATLAGTPLTASADYLIHAESAQGAIAAVLDEKSDKITGAFKVAEQQVLPKMPVVRRKPWISDSTISLIEQRRLARQHFDSDGEKLLHKAIKKSARKDRRTWLLDLAGKGDWKSLRLLRKPRVAPQGRLKDSTGEFVSSEERSETFSKYLQDVQWAVRPTSTMDENSLGPELLVDLSSITEGIWTR